MRQRHAPFLHLTSGILLCSLSNVYASGAVAKRRQTQQRKGGRLRLQGPPTGTPRVRIQNTQQQQVQRRIQVQRQAQIKAQLDLNVEIQIDPADVKDIVSLDDVLASLRESSYVWPLMIDREAKQAVVDHYVKEYREKGVVINKTTTHYTYLIDAMSRQSPDMLAQPFEQLLRVVAILEYDFDNGKDKDDLAVKILGTPQAVRQNKTRLGIQ